MRSILLSDHFNSRKLLRFTYPSILMMLATSVYSIVDGIFVSNYAWTLLFEFLLTLIPNRPLPHLFVPVTVDNLHSVKMTLK